MKNRLFKVLQQYIASDDDMRPAMMGTATDGSRFIACDGHKLVTGLIDNHKMPEIEPQILKFDTKQAMNADFFPQPHEKIKEQLPSYHSVVTLDGQPVDPDNEESTETHDVHHKVSLAVDTLLDFAQTLKKLKVQSVDLFFFKSASRAIAWSAPYAEDADEVKGLLMAMRHKDPQPEYPFTEKDLEKMKALEELVDKTNFGEPEPAE